MSLDPRRDVALLVIAKEPISGQAKTRLAPPLGCSEAAAVAEAALADTLIAVEASRVGRRVLVLDGEPGPWLPRGFEVLPQRGEGLAARLASAFEDAGVPAVLVGMDTPQLTPGLLEAATAELCAAGVDSVLGPAVDGGYWAIGLREPDRRAFEAVPMSSPGTCAAQRRRLDELGLRRVELPELRDVDTFEDAVAVARAAPESRFAGVLGRLAGRPELETR